MNLELEGKTALVSGSSRGIGFAIAEALAKEGVKVVINSSKPDQVDKAVDKLSKTVPGVHVTAAVADLSTARGVENLVEKVPAVDILVGVLRVQVSVHELPNKFSVVSPFSIHQN